MSVTTVHRILLQLRYRAASLAAAFVVIWLLTEAFAFHSAIWPHPVPWLGWADQGHYLDSAFAWRHWDLTPTRHNYPPGYALLGTTFTDLMPWQPFAIPDALCLVVAALLFQRLVARLFPGARAWLIAAPFIFAVASTRLKILREIWFTPWSTTAAVPLQLLALLLALRYREAPGPLRAALWGFSLALLAGVRPVDAALLLAVTGVYLALPPWRAARMVLGDVAAAGTGFVVTVLPLVLLHLAAHRFAPGDYLQRSAVIGFDWRLLPIRWVLLVVDSRPLTAESVGMAARIFWFAPGLAGLLYACITPSAGRSAWRLLAASLLSNLTVYLCYRDLEPGGLWRYHQVHYFKFIFPFLLLASVFLAVALVRANNRLRAVLCLAAVLPLFLLRAEFHPQEGVALEPTANGTALPLGFPTVWDAAMLPLSGAWWPIYRGGTKLVAGSQFFSNVADFKLFPKDGRALLLPLRPLPASGLRLVPGADTTIAPDAQAVYGTVRIVPGIPCFLRASGGSGLCAGDPLRTDP